MKKILAQTVFVLVLTGVLAGHSHQSTATVLTFNFTGNVTSVPDDDSGQLALLNIDNTTTFSGQFSYNTATAASSSTATTAVYTGLGANLLLSQGTTISDASSDVRVSNNDAGFRDSLISLNNSTTSNDLVGGFTMNIILWDTSETMFNSIALPTSLNLANHNFGPNLAVFRGGTGDRDRFFGTFTSLSLVDMPEPTTLALFAMGMLSLGAARKWQKRAD